MPGGFLYFKNAAPSGAPTALSIQDGGTAPTAALTATGWTVAKLAAGNFSLMQAGTKRASTAFSTTDALGTPGFSAASCWRSELAYNGTFDTSTNWTFAFKIRAVSAAASQQGRVKIRLWKSANADGSGATELTTSALVGTSALSITTTASATSTATWTAPGNVTFNNEYFWVQCEWEITALSGNNSGDVVFYIENTARIVTPSFATPPAYAQAHFRFRTDTGLVDDAPTWAKAEDTAILAADYRDINYRLRVSVQNTGPGAPSNAWQLQYSRNGGAYTPITTGSSVVQAVDAGAGSTNDLITVQRLTSASGTFGLVGTYSESGATNAAILGVGSFTEFEYGIKVVPADVVNNDTIDFRIFPTTTGAITQTVTPRITVAVIAGTGTLAAGASALAGTGTVASASGITGTGALVAGNATVAGAGISAASGTGSLAARASTVAGVGATASIGTGALADGSAAVAGVGISASAATGSLVAGAATISGAGATVSTGTGALAAGAAAIAGGGVSAAAGAGALVAGSAAVAGAGTSASAGTGSLVAAGAAIAGIGSSVSIASGTGALVARAATLAGAGVSASVGAGALAAGRAAIAGDGTAFAVGTGTLVAGAAEVVGAGAALSVGDAVAPGAQFDLTLSLQPGAARAEGEQPPVGVIGGRPSSRDVAIPGERLDLFVTLLPGRAYGIVRPVHATARGAHLTFAAAITAGTATGDAVGYDNDLIMLLAA